MQVLNPSFSASFILFSTKLILLTSPVSPTSPIITISFGIEIFLKLDAVDIIIPKSIDGSLIFIPPTKFKYTSCPPSIIPAFFSRTANNKATLL